jgi:hypothetical protein
MLRMIQFLKFHLAVAGKIDPRLGLLFMLITVVLIAGTALNANSGADQPKQNLTASPAAQQLTATPAPGKIEGENTATQLPPEYQMNQQQTVGLTLAAAALVLVVVIGVLLAFMQNPGDV